MNDLLAAVGDAKHLAIAGHIRPDGDCIGSVLAVYHYLQANGDGLVVDMYLDAVPCRFLGIEGAENIQTEASGDEVYDLLIAVDCGDEKRLGKAAVYLKTARRSICVDHHISNGGFADENVIRPDASSTCEVLFDLMEYERMDQKTAAALYLGIAHDTGMFCYSNTTAKTLETAARLMKFDIAHTKMITETFYSKTYLQNQVLGRALMESILVLDGQCIVSAMRKKDMEFYGVESDDLEGIVNQLQLTRGTHVAIFVYEMESQVFKVSMRSDEHVDVSRVAVFFGGGGHVRAAGCSMTGSFHDVINNLLLHIDRQLRDQM